MRERAILHKENWVLWLVKSHFRSFPSLETGCEGKLSIRYLKLKWKVLSNILKLFGNNYKHLQIILDLMSYLQFMMTFFVWFLVCQLKTSTLIF